MGFFIPLAGMALKGLGTAAGATAIAGAIPGVKETFKLDEKSRGKEEVKQGKDKGYDWRTGEINRGLWETALDGLLGNDPTKIAENAGTTHKENLEYAFGDDVASLNTKLSELNQDGAKIDITKTSDPQKLKQKIAQLKSKVPKLSAALSVNPNGNYTINTSDAELDRGIRQGERAENNKAYYDSPQYQQYLDQLRSSDQKFQATMALNTGQMALANKRADNQMQLALMQNQLQARRQDSADRRADRRDRQAMIQQMMQGLASLGASIAI